jgi:hypothetical protein
MSHGKKFTRDRQHIFYHFNMLCIFTLIEVYLVTKKDSTPLDYPDFGIEDLH